MTSIITWFSGTGNSLYVARRIAAGVEGAEILPLAACDPVCFSGPTHLILVAPVYAFAIPRIVSRFIADLPEKTIDRVTVVLTHGGAPGGAAALAARQLNQLGIQRVNAFTVRMVENYPPFGGAPKQKKIDTFLAGAENRITRIVQAVQEDLPHSPSFLSRLLMFPSFLINLFFQKGLPKTDRKFAVTETCNGCGACAAVCPVRNIEIDDGRPVWQGNCEQCFACFHWCPQKAVLFGPRTATQPRYHHPAIKRQDLEAV